MNKWLVVSTVIGLAMIGYVSGRLFLSRVRDRQAFLREFGERFARYLQSEGKDEALYLELTSRVTRMQRELGSEGLVVFRPPFATFAYQNYPLLTNGLSEYRRSASDWALRGQASDYAALMRDALVRYGGGLDELEADAIRDLRNPFVLFRDGVRWVVSLPLRLLNWFGIVSDSATTGILSSTVVRVLSGLLALLAAVASVVQIVSGWDDLLRFLKALGL